MIEEVSGIRIHCNLFNNFFSPTPSKINFVDLTERQKMQYITRSITTAYLKSIKINDLFRDSPITQRDWLVYFMGVGIIRGPIVEAGMRLFVLWSRDRINLTPAFQLLTYMMKQYEFRENLIPFFLHICSYLNMENSENNLKFRFKILMSILAELPTKEIVEERVEEIASKGEINPEEKSVVKEIYRATQELIDHAHPHSVELFEALQESFVKYGQEPTDPKTHEDLQEKIKQIKPIFQLENLVSDNQSSANLKQNAAKAKKSLRLVLSQPLLNSKYSDLIFI